MILADTSIGIDHLRSGAARLQREFQDAGGFDGELVASER